MSAVGFAFGILLFAAIFAYPLLYKFRTKGFYLLSALATASFCSLLTILPYTLAGQAMRAQIQWVPHYNLNLTFYIDLFAHALSLLVTGAGALILFYCARYFQPDDTNTPRFAAVFTSFALSMLGLVTADNVFLMFSFWEATTVLSFLLIGHSGKKRTSRVAASQAIVVTTLGGLAMLVGLVLLTAQVGSADLSAILTAKPNGVLTTVAVYLLLAGALSKSAIFPFHFWLPQAMAAPTPVSAYLHAAAMVKAGIYLLARLGPAFADVPGLRVTLVTLGAGTMILGAVRALRQYDLKLILAHGTVSQLGMLTMLYGYATPETDAAATALLFAHALAKAPLFLSVGMIEHRTGTRDLRSITGLGRSAPGLAIITSAAALSMVGFPPFIGFVAKEAALTELFAQFAQPLGGFTLIVMLFGSVLTTAYTLRYVVGAFSDKTTVHTRAFAKPHTDIYLPPLVFVVLAGIAGVFAHTLDPVYQNIRPSAAHPTHFALWHGFTPTLAATGLVIIAGIVVLKFVGITKTRLFEFDDKYTASYMYFAVMRGLDKLAVYVTGLTQRGSLPYYLSVIMVVAASTLGGIMLWAKPPLASITLGTPVQLVTAAVMIVAAISTIFSRKRFQAVILVGFTGFGMAALYGLHGAPDLALTQMLVEAITLIAFVLVIRRLPQHLAFRDTNRRRAVQVTISLALALVLGLVTLAAMAARQAEPISRLFPELAVNGGHGYNVVNVTLVDIRGWDTFGELSVVVVAATGIASLVFLSARADNLPKLSRRAAKQDVLAQLRKIADPNHPATRTSWMIAGRDLSPERRSIVLEVVVRLLFHALLVLSIYMLLAGHNSPGGGFAGGLVGGMALVARYLAGGRTELGATVPFDAGKIVGLGMAIAAATAVAPLFFGAPVLFSSWIDADLGPFGVVPLVTSTLFDIGVYLVVFGLVLDVLRSLGAQIDVHTETERQVVHK